MLILSLSCYVQVFSSIVLLASLLKPDPLWGFCFLHDTTLCSRLVTFHNVPINMIYRYLLLNTHIKSSATATAIIAAIPFDSDSPPIFFKQFLSC